MTPRKLNRDSTSRLFGQDGRSMFPKGGKEPYERTRKLIKQIAPQLKVLPYRLSIVGHTASNKVAPKPGYGPGELSADRTHAVRQILDAEGVPSGNIFMVVGKADTDRFSRMIRRCPRTAG